jgi:hypothetical protein
MSYTPTALWLEICRQNPQFEAEGATFKPKELVKFFNLIYDQAHKRGVENGRAIEAKEQARTKSSNPGDIFSQVFGKKG